MVISLGVISMEETDKNFEHSYTSDEENKETENKTGSKIVALLVIGLLLFGIAFVLKSKTKPKSTTMTSDGTTVEEPVMMGGNSLSMQDTTPGDTVTLANVTLDDPGYIVIHADANGSPGEVIGHSDLLSEGENSNVVINLDRSSSNGETLYAMVHNDNGDGQYEFPGADNPAVDDDGNTVMVSFTVGSMK